MADFSSTEKINASWKHLFGIIGTSNLEGSDGRMWYEEALAGSHVIVPADIWSDIVPTAYSIATAKSNAAVSGSVVEDRSDGTAITLAVNGGDWDITSSVEPKVGHQITNQHPNPSYIKSITAVTPLGGSNYRITLNSNTGVSSGPAVLQRRIFLTADLSSNGKAWATRTVYGNSFSDIISNFVQPTRFGNGYGVRLFQANGQEIYTTQGAWIFNWQKGLLLFADGFTAANQSYTTPLYVEGFRYIGAFGAGTSLLAGETHDTLRFDGASWVPNNSVKADGSNLMVQNRLTISGSVVIPSGITPTFSGYLGDVGEIRWDNQFVYLHTDYGWARTNLCYF